MHVRTTALLATLAATAGGLAPAASAQGTPAEAPRPAVGFADQKPSMFADPRFIDLDIRHVRLNVPWDVLQDPLTLANVDAWMRGAKARGATPLVTIDRSRRRGKARRNPTAAALGEQVRRWRLRWPGQVKLVSTWNEANINKRPELVAQWWLAVRRSCKGCTVLAADLVDRGNAVSWARRFVKAAKRTPTIWGWHNYIDANTFSTRNTRAFLKGVKGRIWLTETGGVVRRARSTVRFKSTGPTHAARATSFTLKRLAPLDPRRIQRVYLYSWSTAPTDLTWDSGVIGPDGKARPALRVVRCYLGDCSGSNTGPIGPVPPAADIVRPPAL